MMNMNKGDILRKKLSSGPPPGPPSGPADMPGYPGDQADPAAMPNEPPPPGVQDTGAPPGAGPDPQDLQVISQAAQNDPVIAALIRVLGLPV
jgi:hypothetical protein